MKNTIKTNTTIFLKGFLMGICDIIPGISGGTIAFITGIYIRLISAIKNLTPQNAFEMLNYLLKGKIKNFQKRFFELDLGFLLTLFLGIFTAIFSISKLVKFLLENHAAYTLGFFLGLIIASSKIIFDEIESHKLKDISFGIFGFLIGLSMVFLVPKDITNPSLIYTLFGGFVAISALFLPGISGSFILLILGIYEFILESIHNLSQNWKHLTAFGIGAILGAFFISRIITFCYSKDKSKTLYVLFGLVLGSLFVLIQKINASIPTFNFLTIDFLLIFLLFGILIVVVICGISRSVEGGR